MKTNKIMIGILTGLALGTVAGLLLAPDRGSETRRKLSTNGGDLLNNLKNKYNHLIDDITAKLDEVSGEAELADIKLLEAHDDQRNYGL